MTDTMYLDPFVGTMAIWLAAHEYELKHDHLSYLQRAKQDLPRLRYLPPPRLANDANKDALETLENALDALETLTASMHRLLPIYDCIFNTEKKRRTILLHELVYMLKGAAESKSKFREANTSIAIAQGKLRGIPLPVLNKEPSFSFQYNYLSFLIDELLTNACREATQGSPHRRSGVVQIDVSADLESVVVIVSNPIFAAPFRSPVDTERIFEYGYSGSRRPGVGLWLARRILSEHGGSVSVSADDEFEATITIPRSS